MTTEQPITLGGVIFDVDGVLADTVALHFDAWRRLSDEYGCRFDPGIYRRAVDGLAVEDAVRNLMPGAAPDTVRRAARRKQGLFEALLAHRPPRPLPGSARLCHALRRSGVRLAAASGSVNARDILDRVGLLGHFEAVLTAADVPLGKPHPDIFLAAAGRLGLTPARCVVVEDARAGVRAAVAGGFVCVGVGPHGRGALPGADLTVTGLAALDPQTLTRLLGRGREPSPAS